MAESTRLKIREIWRVMGGIPEGEFQKMSKAMQKNYDAICNYLEKQYLKGGET